MPRYKVRILPDDPTKDQVCFQREGARMEVHTGAVRQACHIFGERDSGLPRATVVTERVLPRPKHTHPEEVGVMVRGERDLNNPFRGGIKMPDGRVL